MFAIERYIFRLAFSAFILVLFNLTAVIWVTQALREFDLLTKGQTLWIFLTVTGLSLPLLILVVAPVALFIAVMWTLSKLNGDSELIVISAAGFSPWHVMRPFLILSVAVSVMTGVISLSLAPSSLRLLRELITNVRADIVANIVQEGRFTTLEGGLTFHVRERDQSGLLKGIFVNDSRNKEEDITFIAERGRLVDKDGSSFLILEDGSMQRRQVRSKEPSLVVFDRYAFDLSQFSGEKEITYYKPREKYLSELLYPSADDPYLRLQPGRFRAELHDRLSAPLYPLVFCIMAFAFVGQTRTTRQGRAWAIAGAILAIVGLRIAGFAFTNLLVKWPDAVWLVYGVPVAAMVISLMLIMQIVTVRMPVFLSRINEMITKLLFFRRRSGIAS